MTAALEAAHAANAALHVLKVEADREAVAAWREFLVKEREAHQLVMDGELERDVWAALWSTAPPIPTSAQYANASLVTT